VSNEQEKKVQAVDYRLKAVRKDKKLKAES
jgi:hypothetical protein